MPQGWEFMPWFGMIFGPIVMIAVLATVVAVVVLLLRWLGGGYPPGRSAYPPPEGTQSAALDILEERFAKGEIDKDEFEDKRRTLLRR